MRLPSAPTHQNRVVRPERARRRCRSVTRTASPSGKRFESVTRSIHGCAASAPRDRGEVERDEIPAVPLGERRQDLLGPRRACCPRSSKRRSAKRGPERNRRRPNAAASDEHAEQRRSAGSPGAGACRSDDRAAPQKRGFLLSVLRPRLRYSSPNLTTSPAPSVTSRSPGTSVRSRAVDNLFLFMRYTSRPVRPRAARRVGHELPRDPGHRLLARGIHVHDDADVGRRERPAELLGEVPGPREEVRLEERDEAPLRVDLPRRRQRRARSRSDGARSRRRRARPPRSPFVSKRRTTPVNAPSARAIVSNGIESSRPTAIAASALATLCAPGQAEPDLAQAPLLRVAHVEARRGWPRAGRRALASCASRRLAVRHDAALDPRQELPRARVVRAERRPRRRRERGWRRWRRRRGCRRGRGRCRGDPPRRW